MKNTEKYTKVCYLCDGCGCKEMCINKSEEEWEKYCCHHTTDEAHARNKNCGTRKFEAAVGNDGTICYIEIEKGKKVKHI